LEHFLHHIDGMNDSLSNGIFGLIHSTGESGGPCRYILENFTFLSEKFLNVIFVFDYTFGDNKSAFC
jgi:hypothetical protein